MPVKRKFTKSKRTYRKKKSVTAKVAALSRSVNKLNKISYDKVSLIMGQKTNDSVTLPFYQYSLTNGMNTWGAVFGDNSTDIANTSKMMVNSYSLDVRLNQDNEADRITYTAYIVSLRDQGADASTFDPLNGNLVMTDNIHYVSMNQNGRVFVNRKFFNIHHMKRFTMGGRPGDQSSPETRDLSFRVYPKNKLIENPRGNIFGSGGLTYPRDPSQNYFFLLFNDDSGADLQTNKIQIGGLANVSIAS